MVLIKVFFGGGVAVTGDRTQPHTCQAGTVLLTCVPGLDWNFYCAFPGENAKKEAD